MSAHDFDDGITEEVSEPELEGRGVTLEDFVALMPGHQGTFIFTPCRQPWPGANVNARLPRRHLLDQFGQPVLDEKGKSAPSAQRRG